MKMDYGGIFVVLEGIDGSGTTTQTENLYKTLEKRCGEENLVRTHEPWNSGEVRKRLIEDSDAYSGGDEMIRLYINDRINHVERIISPALNEGKIVLCDRFSMSTYAYQGAQGIPFRRIKKLHESENIPVPDLTFFLDVDYDTSKQRVEGRKAILEKFERNRRFTEEVIRMYRTLAEIDGLFGKHVMRIDGNRSEKEVHDEIVETFNTLFRI